MMYTKASHQIQYYLSSLVMDTRTEHTLRKFSHDTKFRGVVDMPDEFAVIYTGFGRLEESANRNLRKLSKGKCKVLHLGWNTPHTNTYLGLTHQKAALQRRTQGVLLDDKLQEPATCTYSKEDQQNPGLHQENHCQQVEGGEPSHLLTSGEATPGILHPVLAFLVKARYESTTAFKLTFTFLLLFPRGI